MAVAAAPTCFGVENVTVGDITYPEPEALTVTIPTQPVVPIPAVAFAPLPLSLVNVILGATVYPAPGLLN